MTIFSLYQSLRVQWRGARRFARNLPYMGTARWCPVCGRQARRFRQFKHHPNREAMCVYCGALERHRLFWLYVQAHTDLFDGRPKRVLHVAPEPCFVEQLSQRLGEGYLTADLTDKRAMVQMDITDIQFPDNTFDVIYCSHVLEHVPDDRRAMREFQRVLKPGGWAILLVPITAEQTFEDPSVVEPAERLRLFGQEDHVRRYGPDYVDRLDDAGFDVAEFRVTDLYSDSEIRRMGLAYATGLIHHCTKRVPMPAARRHNRLSILRRAGAFPGFDHRSHAGVRRAA
jgi:SAM-dependent methyltransferase